MIQTTVTDIVRSTVTTDNPLRTFYQEVRQFLDLSANRTTLLDALLNECHDLRSQFLRLLGVILVSDPSGGYFLGLSRSMLAHGDLLQQAFQTFTHLLVRQFHTQAELAEVLEQRVCPSRTLTLLVRCIRSRRNRTGVDRRTSGSVSHHLAVAEQLGDQLHVRSLATTGASA